MLSAVCLICCNEHEARQCTSITPAATDSSTSHIIKHTRPYAGNGQICTAANEQQTLQGRQQQQQQRLLLLLLRVKQRDSAEASHKQDRPV
jgi:hypothetical protein